MSDLLQKCSVCQALVDEEDLFCANCGTEAPERQSVAENSTQTFRHNFECQGCGASMSYDASAQTLRCPFCGSSHLENKPDAKALAPNRVVPLAVDRDSAVATMRRWLGKGFWRPSDLSERAAVTTMTAVYVPYWVFAAKTFTYWTADSSQTPFGARGDWVPMSGEHRGSYLGLLVGASSVLTPGETSELCPFDIARGVAPDQIDLDNVIVEQFRVQRKYARPLARAGLENLERDACAQYVPGRNRKLKVNVRLEGLSSEPVLLPIWVMAYRYQDRVFRFLINGQTGRATGQAPTSWKKVFLAIIIGIAILLTILGLLGLGGAIATSDAGEHGAQGVRNAYRATPVSAMMRSNHC
ncbi:MAG: hypothetical protein H8E66_32260 [Planctomycetes bacterium]|nr:hypothetical protein [Planctomycetota bacterium]